MGMEIKLQDNCRIIYACFPVLIRSYTFEYKTFNGITHKDIYDIYFETIDFKDQYTVRTFMRDYVYFDTFDEAKAYVLKQCSETCIRLNIQEGEIKEFNNKKRRKNKK